MLDHVTCSIGFAWMIGFSLEKLEGHVLIPARYTLATGLEAREKIAKDFLTVPASKAIFYFSSTYSQSPHLYLLQQMVLLGFFSYHLIPRRGDSIPRQSVELLSLQMGFFSSKEEKNGSVVWGRKSTLGKKYHHPRSLQQHHVCLLIRRPPLVCNFAHLSPTELEMVAAFEIYWQYDWLLVVGLF